MLAHNTSQHVSFQLAFIDNPPHKAATKYLHIDSTLCQHMLCRAAHAHECVPRISSGGLSKSSSAALAGGSFFSRGGKWKYGNGW